MTAFGLGGGVEVDEPGSVVSSAGGDVVMVDPVVDDVMETPSSVATCRTVYSCVFGGSLPSGRLIWVDWVVLSRQAASICGSKGTCHRLSGPRWPANHPLLIQLMTV